MAKEKRLAKPVLGKTQAALADEWDRFAETRAKQLSSGQDLSHDLVLVPWILKLSEKSDFEAVLDVGCGPGFLTRKLAKKAKRVVGIDMSSDNIRIAENNLGGCENVELVTTTVEEYGLRYKTPVFTLGIANMFLMTCLNLNAALQSISELLKPGAHLVFTITHPWFWPVYWDYAFEDWFRYNKEIAIESPFRISLAAQQGYVTTHIHRSLEQYISSLKQARFEIDQLVEPMPSDDVQRTYPKSWEFPRFLAMRCIRV